MRNIKIIDFFFQAEDVIRDIGVTGVQTCALPISKKLIERGVRVNAVAPGPIWTPLIPSTFPPDKVEEFGTNTPMGRVGQPEEVANCFVFLASDDSSYIAGQFLHPNGGKGVKA